MDLNAQSDSRTTASQVAAQKNLNNLQTQAQLNSLTQTAADTEANQDKINQILQDNRAKNAALDRQFAEQQIQFANQDAIAEGKAQLAQINIINKDKLAIENQNVLDQLAIDLAGNTKSADEKLAIVAEANKKILDNNIAFNNELAAQDTARYNAETEAQLAQIDRTLAAQAKIQNSPKQTQAAQALGVPILDVSRGTGFSRSANGN